MGGDEGMQLMLFPGLMQMRQGSTAAHAYSLPGFPPQVHLPMLPGAYTYARPGYAYAQAHAFAYPPPPPGPYAYPPQGYPHPGSPALPHQQGHGSSGHGGGGRQVEVMESTPKAAGGTIAATAATATYGGISHGSSGHGGGRQIEMTESTPKAAGGTTASATASYGAISNLFRGQGISRNNGGFCCCGNCCGGHHRGTSFKYADGHGHQGKFKRGHRPAKVEHVHGKFRAKCTTWKY